MRRAQAQLGKAIARRDPEGAADALLGLDKLAREPELAPCASLFRQALPELHRQSAWGRLHTLAARSEQEPRLLSHGADDAAVAHALWPLFLACMRARDYARAQRLWQKLYDWIAGRAPALSQAIAAWLAGRGQVESEALAGLDLRRLPEPAPVDQRLGVDSSARWPKPPPPAPPATPESVPDSVHLLFATQSLRQVGDILLGGQAGATPEIAASFRHLAGSLAMRELLLRASSGEGIGEAAQLLARIVHHPNDPTPDDLANEILLAIRFLVGRMGVGSASRDEREALSGLMAALVRLPAFAAVADVLARDFAEIPPLAPLALQVCEHALARARDLAPTPFFALWSQALALHSPRPEHPDDERERSPAPAWLQSASRLACERGKELGSFLATLAGWARARWADALAWGLPYLITVDLIEAVWNHANDEVRRDLAERLDDLILDAEDASIERVMSNPRSVDFTYVERMAAAAEAADPGLPFIGADGLKVWRRLGAKALPFNVRLLPFALFEAKDPSRHFDAAKAYVGNRPEIDAWLEVIDELQECDTTALVPLLTQIERHVLGRYQDDRPALARALIWGYRTRARLDFVRDLAHAYARASLTNGLEVIADEKLAARIAAIVLRLGTKARGTKPSASKPKKRKPRQPRSNEQRELFQLDLPLPIDEEKP